MRFLFSEENCDKEENNGLITETGYRKPLSLLKLEDIPQLKQTLRDHVLVKVKAELDQFCEGLTTLGVLDKVKMYPSLMAPLFTDIGRKELDKSRLKYYPPYHKNYTNSSIEFFKDLLNPLYSTNNPVRREKEEAAFIYFLDFLEECEGRVLYNNRKF